MQPAVIGSPPSCSYLYHLPRAIVVGGSPSDSPSDSFNSPANDIMPPALAKGRAPRSTAVLLCMCPTSHLLRMQVGSSGVNSVKERKEAK